MPRECYIRLGEWEIENFNTIMIMEFLEKVFAGFPSLVWHGIFLMSHW